MSLFLVHSKRKIVSVLENVTFFSFLVCPKFWVAGKCWVVPLYRATGGAQKPRSEPSPTRVKTFPKKRTLLIWSSLLHAEIFLGITLISFCALKVSNTYHYYRLITVFFSLKNLVENKNNHFIVQSKGFVISKSVIKILLCFQLIVLLHLEIGFQ